MSAPTLDRDLLDEALFASPLQRSQHPSPELVRSTVQRAVDRFGPDGCAGAVAQEFGDHPDAAWRRMQWARAMVREAFGEPDCA